MKARLDYAENPDKTNEGDLVSSYECDPHLAWQEFMLDRNHYLSRNGSERQRDVLAYQIRQSFKPGEVSPEDANKIGYELAHRFTKGKHAFVVSTHIDRPHIHNHIIFNAVDLQGERKFRDFFLSARALRKLNDLICLEHKLSVVEEKPRSNSQQKYSFGLMKDFTRIIQEKRGKGYEIWARHFNNTQAAEVLIFLQENNIDSLEKLDKLADASSERYHTLSDEIKACEKRLKEIGETKKAIADYIKTRSTFEAYRKIGYNKAFYEKHRDEIILHRAAKMIFDKLETDKIPSMKELSDEYGTVLSKKKEAYADYRKARNKMKKYAITKKNVDMILVRESIPERNAQPSRDA